MEIRVFALVLLVLSAALPAEAQNWGAFRRKHIYLSMNRNRCTQEIYAKRINRPGTCKVVNNFIRATDNQVINVCRGAGRPVGGNFYESKFLFTVVSCRRKQSNPCRYYGHQNLRYITVACQDGFPVNYQSERPG